MKRSLSLILAVLAVISLLAFPTAAEESLSAQDIINLYDFYQSNGEFVNADGTLGAVGDLSCYGGIPVNGGQTVYFGPCEQDGIYLASYNGAGTFICRATADECTLVESVGAGKAIYSYKVPAVATTLWAAADNDYAMDFVLTAGQALTADLLDGYHAINPLTGKSALFVGDSICHGVKDTPSDHYGWAGRIGDSNGMAWVNNGESGYSVSNCRLKHPQYGIIGDKLLEYKGRSFDYILLHGGVNDAWDKVAVGTVTEGYDPASFNSDTFAGALEKLFYDTYYYYGKKATVGYLVNFAMPTASQASLKDMSAYFDIAKEICDKWDVRYFDMYENTKVISDMKIGTASVTTLIPDHIHPNAAGYDVLSPMIEGFMKTLTKTYMPGTEPPVDDGKVYSVTFCDEDGSVLATTTATRAHGVAADAPALISKSFDGIVSCTFEGWEADGELVDSLDMYDFTSDVTFTAVYADVGYGARFEDTAPVVLGDGNTVQELLPEAVALHPESHGITMVYKVEGAESEIIADDWLIYTNDSGAKKPAVQWASANYSSDGLSPNHLELNNGYYFVYVNQNLNGTNAKVPAKLNSFTVFNPHSDRYDPATAREPLNTNEAATFQMLAVTSDNLQPTATFRDEEGNVLGTYTHKYTNVNANLGYGSGSNMNPSCQEGQILSIDEVTEKAGVQPQTKAPTHGGLVTYEFAGWVDAQGNPVEAFYYTCDLYPDFRIVSDEREEHTVTFMNGDRVHVQVAVKDGDAAALPASPEKANDGFIKYTFAGWVDAQGADANLRAVSGDTTVYAAYTESCEHPFTDVEDGRYYTEAVEWALMRGVMNGTSETAFTPDGTTTRAMIVTVLYRLEGTPSVTDAAQPFADVVAGSYYEDAVKWAYANDVVTGVSEREFAPTASLTREQFATVIYRYAAEIEGEDVSVGGVDMSGFTDADEVSDYAKNAMAWAVKSGLITGTTSTTLSPGGGTTRAQMATILYRFVMN